MMDRHEKKTKTSEGKLSLVDIYGRVWRGDKPPFIPVTIAGMASHPSSRSSHYYKRKDGVEETVLTQKAGYYL